MLFFGSYVHNPFKGFPINFLFRFLIFLFYVVHRMDKFTANSNEYLIYCLNKLRENKQNI